VKCGRRMIRHFDVVRKGKKQDLTPLFANGLLRQFFPKGTDFVQVTAKEIKAAMENLNNRPRKTRKYFSPNEIFKGEFISLI